MINIDLFCKGNLPHLQQIFSGLNMLEDKNLCKVDVHCKDIHTAFGGVMDLFSDDKPICFLIFDGVKVAIDTLDGYNFNDKFSRESNLQLMDRIADEVDFYFKRSYSAEVNAVLHNESKIYPLGFNYFVNDRRRTIQKKINKRLGKSLKCRLSEILPPPPIGEKNFCGRF